MTSAADLARLLAGGQAEPESGLDAEYAELARTYNLPAELASRIRGETPDERRADAEQLARFAPKGEPEHVALARRAIAAAESEEVRAARLREQIGFDAHRAERDRALVEALHPTPSEEADQ